MLVPYKCEAEKYVTHYQKVLEDPYARYHPYHHYLISNSELPEESSFNSELSYKTPQEESEFSDDGSQGDSVPSDESSQENLGLSVESSQESERSDGERGREIGKKRKLALEKYRVECPQEGLELSDESQHEVEISDDESEREIVMERKLPLRKYQDSFSQRPTRNEKCDNLPSSFGEEVNRLLEIMKLRQNNPAERPRCDDSNFMLKSNDAEEPMRRITHAKEDSSRYSCSICKAKFTFPDNLIRHEKSKHGSVSYTCSVCHKVFSRKDALKRHVNTH